MNLQAFYISTGVSITFKRPYRLGGRKMLDYHVHPDYSIDAQGTLEEFCEAALKRGLREIAFTTHVDSDPETEDFFVVVEGKRVEVRDNAWLEHYENAIRTIGDFYEDRGLRVKLGVELDLYPGVTGNLPELFFRTDFDIVIGSVHLIDHKAISLESEAREVFSKYTMEEIGETYFSILIESIESSLVDVLGHLDIYRRYGESYYGDAIYSLWKPHLDELVEVMSKYRVGFEINTSSWRKGQKEQMPATQLLSALLDGGINVVTVGSDAHRPDHVGYGIDRAIDIITELGISGPSSFTNGKAQPFIQS